MNFDTSKNLGGIGAILMFIGFIIPVGTGGYGFLLSLVGIILVLIGLKGLADYYNEAGIFNNFLYGSITSVVGVVIAAVTAFFVVITSLTSFLQTLYPGWNGDFATLPTTPPDVSTINPADLAPLLMSILVLVVILFVTAIIAAVFMRKSMNSLSAKAGVGLFGTAGLLLLIGAVLTIIAVGLLLIWIAFLIMAIAFFSMRPQQAQPATPTMVS